MTFPFRCRPSARRNGGERPRAYHIFRRQILLYTFLSPITAPALQSARRTRQGRVSTPRCPERARHARHDRPALPQSVERLCVVARLPERTSEFGIRHRQIALPAGVVSYGLQRTSVVTLWNGEPGDGPGGTEHMIELMKKLTGRQPIIIDPATL
jgi:hypothetical protein